VTRSGVETLGQLPIDFGGAAESKRGESQKVSVSATTSPPSRPHPPSRPKSWDPTSLRSKLYDFLYWDYINTGGRWIRKKILTDLVGDTMRNRISEIRAWLLPLGWDVDNDYIPKAPKDKRSYYRLEYLHARGSHEIEIHDRGPRPPGREPGQPAGGPV